MLLARITQLTTDALFYHIERTRHTVTPEHTKTPPAAEIHHATAKKQQIHTNRKETGVYVTPIKKIATRPTQPATLNEQFELCR
jgi:hypothetical protein